MGFVSRFFYFFTPYTDGRERAIGRFFSRLTEQGSQAETRIRLEQLIQQDIASINLWTEYRYKGYRYLRKATRRKLYANLHLIAADFDRLYTTRTPEAETVMAHIHHIAPQATVDPKKALLISALMDYFAPERGRYEYRASSSFGRLLRDPSRERLIGDCNQIVTLYIYLYTRYYEARDLQVRVLPGHVALHYGGIDIETTTGQFANYDSREGNRLLPLEEIVSINLLDMTDSYLATHEVAAEDVLQASRVAYILSHEQEIVASNLHAAYRQLINTHMERHNYKQALKFALASQDTAILDVVGHNGTLYEIEHHNFAAARRLARYAPDSETMIRNAWRSEGAYHYQARRYHDAIKAFKHTGSDMLVQQCYEALFFEAQKQLGPNLTTQSIKNQANTIRRMQEYARKSGDKKLMAHADQLAQHL